MVPTYLCGGSVEMLLLLLGERVPSEGNEAWPTTMRIP